MYPCARRASRARYSSLLVCRTPAPAAAAAALPPPPPVPVPPPPPLSPAQSSLGTIGILRVSTRSISNRRSAVGTVEMHQRKALYTSSLRPHTLVAQGRIH